MVGKIVLDEKENVTGVQLKGCRLIPCGLVVAATGVKSEISFLEGTSVEVGRGIRVNEYQQTSYPDIYAAGDVCESMETFTGKITTTPIWPLYEKIIIKDGRPKGAILQGDISRAGVLGALIREDYPVRVVLDKLFDLSYACFFHERENGEFTYQGEALTSR